MFPALFQQGAQFFAQITSQQRTFPRIILQTFQQRWQLCHQQNNFAMRLCQRTVFLPQQRTAARAMTWDVTLEA